MTQRILVMGAPGSGSSTLGRALATALGSQHFDADDFYWLPTDPAFLTSRPVKDREALMDALFVPRSDWVLTASPMRWGQNAVQRLTHTVFITLDPTLRIARLTARERTRYGSAIDPGGDRHALFTEFVDWAQGYDDPANPGPRTRTNHEAWLGGQPVPIIRVDSAQPTQALVAQVLDALPSPP